MSGFIINPSRFAVVDGGVSAPLGSILASTVFDLDATIAASYTSGQVWANYEDTPADSSGQTDNDFELGADSGSSTDDPTFTGAPGNSDAYWALDGGDYWSISANTAFIESIQKTTGGSDFWFAFAYRHVEGVQQFLLGTVAGSFSLVGIKLAISGSEKFFLTQFNGATQSLKSSTEVLVGGTDYLVVVTHSHSSNLTDFYINDASVESIAHTFGITTTNAALTLKIAAQGDASQQMHNGTRVYNVSWGNEYLDATKAATIRTHLASRHGREYITP
ncbi:MAG: hypothetical protein ACUZ8E_17555 [Candidatus Anammoxibacter sp.]